MPLFDAVPPGKHRRLSRLAGPDGRFAMLAVDQRRSLRRMIVARTGRTEASIRSDELTAVKHAVTEAVAPLATAVLIDPLYGYPATLDALPPHVGIILSGEVSGYELHAAGERRSRLIEGWSVAQSLRLGADAVKLLIWHHPEASPATQRHQEAVVASVGEACAEAEVPFVLEVLTYGLDGQDRLGRAFAAIKPDLVAEAAQRYSAPRFGVDLLKLEFPASLRYVEEYQDTSFGAGEVVYDRAAAVAACERVDSQGAVPWVLLSAGVEPDEFVANVRIANAAGASGFLCGRVVWKRVVDAFPDPEAMTDLARQIGRPIFERIRDANEGARPWIEHPNRNAEGAGSDRKHVVPRPLKAKDDLLNQTKRARTLSAHVAALGEPILKSIVRRMHTGALPYTTLLAVCPNSEAVTRAALRAAKRVDAPVLFAATLNQVDADGGYTGWTPHSLVAFVAAEAQRIGLDTPILPCLDHGGPWLKDRHTTDGLSLDETLAAVKTSLNACLDAGYALLHIDATVDHSLPEASPLPVETVVERTLDLIAHAESYRAAYDLPPVAYEVGTEEVHGGLADLRVFETFLGHLDIGLRERDLAHAWPAFVVGKVGTDLHTTDFEPRMAQALTERLRPYGALVKGHYTDYVTNPEDYPLAGMGGANVGPEFTEVEYGALAELVTLEKKIGKNSGLERAIFETVDASGRWKKWLRPDERGIALGALDPARRGWIVRTSCRYIWTAPRVVEARQALYHHLDDVAEPDAYVLWRVETAILHYYHRFNLVGLNRRMLDLTSDCMP